MRWLRFRTGGHEAGRGPARVGFVHEGRLLEVDLPDSDCLLGVIRLGGAHRRELVKQTVSAAGGREGIELESVRLLAPLDPPTGDVIAIGRNYAEHAGEMARVSGTAAERPTVFTKAQTTINGPYDDIIIDPKVSSQVDWEVELGVVIGSECRDIRPVEALDHVFGYTVLNDVSARDIQYDWGGQYYKGKSIDGYCPTGPWIVTADEIPDPGNLELTLRVNGEVKQQGTTRDMIFSVVELVSQLSLGQTLRPGTLIATGTPPGVGYARDPKEFLRPGDLMETEISGIGTIRNRMVASDPGIYRSPREPGR